MGASALIQAIARAYFARERDRLGIGASQRADQQVAIQAQQAQSSDLVRQAQIAKALQDMGFAPEEHAAALAHVRAQTDLANAGAEDKRNPKPLTAHYERDEQGNVTAVIPQRDGTFVKVPVGDISAPQRPAGLGRGAVSLQLPIPVLDKTTNKMVLRSRADALANPDRYDPPPTTAERNAASGSTSGQMALKIARGRAVPILQDLGSRIVTLNKGSEGGFMARAGGVARRAAGSVGVDPASDLYTSGVRGFIPLFARAVGHSGVLTEIDVQRTEGLFPRIGDSHTTTTEKLARIQRIMTGTEPMPFQWEHPEYDSQGVAQPDTAAPVAAPGVPAPTASPGRLRILSVEEKP